MKLTKYVHACVVLEDEGKKVIIDPGAFTPNLPDLTDVVALIITHEHQDHFSADHIQNIVSANPDLEIFAADGVAEQLPDIEISTVAAGEECTAGTFSFKFFGGLHAEVHKIFQRPANIGVLINDSIYYPGDSFDTPDTKPKVLLVPTSGPWLKTGEIIDFISKVKPTGLVIPTHNALQSELGDTLTEDWLRSTCEKQGATFKHIAPGESIDL